VMTCVLVTHMARTPALFWREGRLD
jgi:hypothetical protein